MAKREVVIEYCYAHACHDVPTDAAFCPHCGCPDPYAEIAVLLIEQAMEEIRSEITHSVRYI